MDELKKLREKINCIDAQMARLFEERMDLVEKVADLKKDAGIAVSDKEREEQVVSRGVELIEKEQFKDLYKEFIVKTIDLSVKYQQERLGKGTINCEDVYEESFGQKCSESHVPQNVIIEREALSEVKKYFDLNRKVLVVTDKGVPADYADQVCNAAKDSVLVVIEAGEASKTLDNLRWLYEKMMENNFTRKDCIVAVGGGVVGDLAGLAAATYMRGIDFYNIPTTLLAQVDASIGGKSAVNLAGIKNIVGSIRKPCGVLIDPAVLKTLDKRQLACGAAEIIKIAAVFDEGLFCEIEKNGILGNLKYIEEIIRRAVKIKEEVVKNDESDRGVRRALNFGHTLGHGIENATGMFHGEAVALGMLPMCSEDVRERIKKLLLKEGLPVKYHGDGNDGMKIIEAAAHDKKAQGDRIITVRVDKIGTFRFQDSSPEELLEIFEEVFS